MNKITEQFLQYIEVNAPKFLSVLIIVVVGIVIIKLLVKIIKTTFTKSKVDPTCHKFITSLIKILLYLLLFIIALTKLEVPMTSIIAVLSVAGLAVSLAVQSSLSNLASGFILLFSKPFKVGDFIEVGGVSGTVRYINILQTKLLTFDNKAIYIPNGQVFEDKIVNYSNQDTRRLDLTVSISYKDDFEKAKSIIASIVEKHELALAEPAPLIRVCELSSHSVNIALKVWVNKEDYWSLNFDLLEMIKKAFDDNGITIPFNQLDVTVNSIGASKL